MSVSFANVLELASAQAHFHVPELFSVSLSLRGAEPGDPWFLVDAEFDINVGGDDTGVVSKSIEIPSVPVFERNLLPASLI